MRSGPAGTGRAAGFPVVLLISADELETKVGLAGGLPEGDSDFFCVSSCGVLLGSGGFVTILDSST